MSISDERKRVLAQVDGPLSAIILVADDYMNSRAMPEDCTEEQMMWRFVMHAAHEALKRLADDRNPPVREDDQLRFEIQAEKFKHLPGKTVK